MRSTTSSIGRPIGIRSLRKRPISSVRFLWQAVDTGLIQLPGEIGRIFGGQAAVDAQLLPRYEGGGVARKEVVGADDFIEPSHAPQRGKGCEQACFVAAIVGRHHAGIGNDGRADRIHQDIAWREFDRGRAGKVGSARFARGVDR